MNETVLLVSHLHVDAAGNGWPLHWSGLRFDVRLLAGALVCDYLGAEIPAPPEPLWDGWREQDMRQNVRLNTMMVI